MKKEIIDMNREDYRAKQKQYKEIQKNRGKWLWISKLPDRVINGKVEKNPLNKGRTYVKKDGE